MKIKQPVEEVDTKIYLKDPEEVMGFDHVWIGKQNNFNMYDRPVDMPDFIPSQEELALLSFNTLKK